MKTIIRNIVFFSLFSILSFNSVSHAASGIHSICQYDVKHIAESYLEFDDSGVVVITKNGQISIPDGGIVKMNGPSQYTGVNAVWDCDYTIAGGNSENDFTLPWENKAKYSKIINYNQLMTILMYRSKSTLNFSNDSWTIIKRQFQTKSPQDDLYEYLATEDYFILNI